MEIINTINNRYTGLAESNCCLSCGGAVNHAQAKQGEICVDLGSGRGNDVLRMADAVGPMGFIYGIDASDGMIARAEKNAHKFGYKNVSFIQTELHSLPLQNGSADLVISNCTINHAEDKKKVWSEIYRVLKKGGRFVVSDIYATAPVPGQYRNDPVAVAECWAGADTREVYFDTLRSSGFNDVIVLEESAPYPKGSVEVCSFTIKGIKQ